MTVHAHGRVHETLMDKLDETQHQMESKTIHGRIEDSPCTVTVTDIFITVVLVELPLGCIDVVDVGTFIDAVLDFEYFLVT